MWRPAIITTCRFHTSVNRSAKLANVMRKVMGSTSKKKKIYSDNGILPSAEVFSKGSQEGRYSGSARRASVLNKLFMKHITDLIATGEYSSEFLGLGIEINRVKIAPDYNGLNVFWIAKGTQDDEKIEKILKKNAGFLRHELSSLRVMGVVPTIYFVKDKKFAQILEVDSRLSKADFGEDFVATEMATKLKTQLELFTPLPSDVKENIQKIDADSYNDEIDEEEVLPPMPQDVLGLNHLEILNRIKKNIKKSLAIHRTTNSGIESTPTVNENPIEFSNNKERRIAFKEFLAKRELLRSKKRKAENYFPDIEYMREEFEERRIEHFKNLNTYEDEADFVDEDQSEDVDSEQIK